MEPTAFHKAVMVRSAMARRSALSLAEARWTHVWMYMESASLQRFGWPG